MSVLLTFLLVVGLPWVETNATETGRQGGLKCHSCEEIDSLQCVNPRDCEVGYNYCATVIVRFFVRFFYVSRQCAKYCPDITPHRALYKSFILVKPTPFLYAECCKISLCNTHAPKINDTEANYFREAGRAGHTRSSSAGLVLLLTLAAVSLGLRPPASE